MRAQGRGRAGAGAGILFSRLKGIVGLGYATAAYRARSHARPPLLSRVRPRMWLVIKRARSRDNMARRAIAPACNIRSAGFHLVCVCVRVCRAQFVSANSLYGGRERKRELADEWPQIFNTPEKKEPHAAPFNEPRARAQISLPARRVSGARRCF